MRKTRYIILLALLWSLALHAGIPEMKFRRLDTRNGLSNSQVNCVYRDSRGFVWIGTAYGLNRYDGYRVKTFYANMRDTTTMRDNYTSEIMEAWDGKLWVRQGMNYCIYDPVTEKFERNISQELEKYFGFNQGVERVYIDARKNFWVKFYELGLYYYNPHTKKITHFKPGYTANELNPTYAISNFADDGEELLIVTTNGVLIRLHGEQEMKLGEDKWMPENGSPENRDYRICVDPKHNIWVATELSSYVKLNRDRHWRKGLSALMEEYQIDRTLANIQIWDIKIDRKGRVWCATDHNGLVIFDLENHQVRQFLNNKLDESSISDNTLRNIYFDDKGLVWLGSYKNGVNMYKEGSAAMRNVDLGDINTISEDRYGNYWLGTNDKGILVYNPKTGEVMAHYTKENSPMVGNIMVGSCRASDGSIWFGGYNSGLTHCIVKGSNGEATIVNYHFTGTPDGLATDNVWSITEDKWHRIWISTLGAGFQMLDLKTGKFRTWNTKNTNLPSDYMSSISWIKKGWLIIGTSWYYCFVNPVTGKVANRIIPEDPSVPVQTGSTNCVMEDSRGIIWQGSSSGVIAYDQKRKSVKLLDMQAGLFGSSVTSIVEDKAHAMWVATDHGLSKIVPQLDENGTWRFAVRSYNNRDGLQMESYNQRSAILTHDGLLLIGGQGGMDIINPKALSDASSKERPIFSGLQLFDVDVPVGREIDGRMILDEALDECRELTLNYNDQFTIQMGSDAGTINNGKRFVYKLEGFNENWVRTSELNPNIIYNSLHAGSYTLCVRMLNDDGTMGEVESRLDITIKPALWRTRWAMLLYILFIALVALVWRRRYMKRQTQRMNIENLRRETEKEQWMGEMRMKMAAEQQSAPVQEEKPQEEMKLVRQTTNVVTMLRHICEDYQHMIGSKAKVTFLSAAKQLDVDIAKNEFNQAMHILLDNSVKFAPGECRISVGVARTADGKAQIQVADNGIGIRDEYKVHAFDHLPGVDNVGLPIVKDIVVAHDGDIRMEDNPGGGTIFFITLPLADEIEEAIVMED